MASVRLSTKGQLIIPKDIRDRHGWGPGTELSLEDRDGAVILREASPALPETTLQDLIGCTGYRGPARTLEDMEEAIAKGAREQR